MTEKLLTEKFEREIDILIEKWLPQTEEINQAQLTDIMYWFGVIECYTNETTGL